MEDTKIEEIEGAAEEVIEARKLLGLKRQKVGEAKRDLIQAMHNHGKSSYVRERGDGTILRISTESGEEKLVVRIEDADAKESEAAD